MRNHRSYLDLSEYEVHRQFGEVARKFRVAGIPPGCSSHCSHFRNSKISGAVRANSATLILEQ